MKDTKTYTAGNVIIEDIKIGDIHYEYDFGCGIKCEVVTLPIPEKDDDGTLWTWRSKNVNRNAPDDIIDYAVHSKYAHYGPKLYDYEAYQVKHYI